MLAQIVGVVQLLPGLVKEYLEQDSGAYAARNCIGHDQQLKEDGHDYLAYIIRLYVVHIARQLDKAANQAVHASQPAGDKHQQVGPEVHEHALIHWHPLSLHLVARIAEVAARALIDPEQHHEYHEDHIALCAHIERQQRRVGYQKI